jgi:hypothetical protein
MGISDLHSPSIHDLGGDFINVELVEPKYFRALAIQIL